MKALPADYPERVYAGVLGKIIGVYLGRPVEGWSHSRIARELGEIDGYVNFRLDPAAYITELVVTDDDISGTFIFPRALADCGFPPRLTAGQIGNTWLNYVIEGRTVLWWGGIGTATEHTAYWRLTQGVAAPESGSAARNGRILAEQIGGQIFIDGWALVSPGDPEQAAYLAEQAARVSHDGVAVDAARLIAAMEAQAFVEPDVGRLLDTGLRFVPAASPLRPVVADLREWHAADVAADWRATRERVERQYRYDRYGGACHVVPNHALVILALLYGGGSFRRSLAIVCAAGWDTDCNAGNLGCLLGIRGGLAGIDAGPDWRGPVADRMFLPAADSGAVTDAVIETRALLRAGCLLAGRDPPADDVPRFGFDFPGSLQGFGAEGEDAGAATLANVSGHSGTNGRSLAIRLHGIGSGVARRVGTATFFTPQALDVPGYRLMGSPALHSGQALRLRVEADPDNGAGLIVRPYLACFGTGDRLLHLSGLRETLTPGAAVAIRWRVPDTGGRPICRVGLEIAGTAPTMAEAGLYLDYLDWDGAPDTVLRRPDEAGRMWRHAWVDAADQFTSRWEAFRIAHGSGLGMLIQGGRGWGDYEVAADLTPHLARSWGLATRVGGLRRHIAVVFDDAAGQGGAGGNRVSIRRTRDRQAVLAAAEFHWTAGRTYAVSLAVRGSAIQARVNGTVLIEARDAEPALAGSGLALLCQEGSLSTEAVAIRPLPRSEETATTASTAD